MEKGISGKKGKLNRLMSAVSGMMPKQEESPMPKSVKKATRAPGVRKTAQPRTEAPAATGLPAAGEKKELRLSVDYPQESETIWNGHYAVRITACDCDGIEVSIDGQAARPCRNVAGHWWFDLRGLSAGSHLLTARLHKGGNDAVASRQFNVKE